MRTIYSKYIKESFLDRVLEDSLLAMVGAGIGGGLFLVTIIIIGELLASKMTNTRISFKRSKYEEKH